MWIKGKKGTEVWAYNFGKADVMYLSDDEPPRLRIEGPSGAKEFTSLKHLTREELIALEEALLLAVSTGWILFDVDKWLENYRKEKTTCETSDTSDSPSAPASSPSDSSDSSSAPPQT